MSFMIHRNEESRDVCQAVESSTIGGASRIVCLLLSRIVCQAVEPHRLSAVEPSNVLAVPAAA